MATLAAPMPIMAILTLAELLAHHLEALISPARTTVAVPCWSSCQTGMSISA